MAFNHTLSAILRGQWLIDKQWADDHIMMVIGMINGNPINISQQKDKPLDGIISFAGQSGYSGIKPPRILDPVTMQEYAAYVYDNNYKLVANPNIPENSVAVIQVSGPITKYNGDCGEPGSIQLANYIAEMSRRTNIGSMVMVSDTPGGEARASHAFVDTIQKSSKPILAFVDDMAASLGVWLTAACDEVFLSNKMGQIGSIGSYCRLLDFTGKLEKEGIKLHEIYAPQSKDKNKDYRDALEGDYTAIENDLKLHVDQFISFVKTKRPMSASSEKTWSTGKMFYADDAIKLGLADGVMPFTQVVARAAWLAKRKK